MLWYSDNKILRVGVTTLVKPLSNLCGRLLDVKSGRCSRQDIENLRQNNITTKKHHRREGFTENVPEGIKQTLLEGGMKKNYWVSLAIHPTHARPFDVLKSNWRKQPAQARRCRCGAFYLASLASAPFPRELCVVVVSRPRMRTLSHADVFTFFAVYFFSSSLSRWLMHATYFISSFREITFVLI